jgi:hypothetical protein
MSLTKATYSMIEGAPVNVLDFGADPTGVADSTAALQAALDSGSHDIYIPEGTYLFSALTVGQNTRLHGASTRTSILKHTGSGVAITCLYSGGEPDGSVPYIENGWFIFQDFELLVNGTVGFNVGNTRSSFTNWERIYMRHRQDGGTYFPGSTAIQCIGDPLSFNDPMFLEKLNNVFIRGFETGVVLDQTVNAWELNRVWMIEVKDQLSINLTTGVNIIGCYFESGIAGARGIVFGSGGGNNITIVGSTIELTNLGATQYAYDFTAGGTWQQITPVSVKYLIAGDAGSVNARRIKGTPPEEFIELNRSYTSVTFGAVPMLWGPGVDSGTPFQLPNTIRAGGFQQGQGQLRLGRNDGDSNDFVLAYAASGDWSLSNSNGVKWLTGLSTPEGVVTAAPGSLYTNLAGGAGTTLYVKESGSGNTGWVAK